MEQLDENDQAVLTEYNKLCTSLTEEGIWEDWNISVYRLTAVTPGLMQFRFDGNFNTMGKTYSLFENDVYYTKYNRDRAVRDKWSSEHFAAFLSHESFHYYMQNQWAEGSRFSADSLTSEDRDGNSGRIRDVCWN